MTDIRTEIISVLKQVLPEFTNKKVNFSVERPVNENFGDYSTNAALAAFSDAKLRFKTQNFKGHLELARKIVDSIIHDSKFMIHFSKVEAVAPGFVNFWLSEEYLIDQLNLILNRTPLRHPTSQEFRGTRGFAGRGIMVEFTDPNPFKEFHIGHLYNSTVGEAISRLLEAQGADVKRANYQGDVGMHVAKALYGIFHLCHAEFSSASQILENKILKQVQDDNLNKKVKILGEAYAFGAKKYEEDEEAKKEIEGLNKKIYNKEPDLMPLYEKGKQWSLEYLETIYKRLGTKFDFYYFESEVGTEGLKIVREFLKKGVFEESQGAIIFPGKKQNLHDRVFINSLGLPTYEAKELGLAFRKYRDFQFDQSIVVTGNEIIGYFKVLLAALGKIRPEMAAKTKHLTHGMVRLPTGKMSSRTGNIVTGEWLLDETKNLLKSKYSEMNEETLEKVAVGAVKYALLKNSLGHDIEFNFEESISIQGNSGPYLQYTFARTQSVLSKATGDKHKISFTRTLLAKLEAEETSLLRLLGRFPEVVENAGKTFAPNILCNYLFDLAQKFNLFYQKHKILQSRIQEQREFRLALTVGVGQVIKNGLQLLGISAPEKM